MWVLSESSPELGCRGFLSQKQEDPMEASLIGCLVLIAEDHPLIALEIKQGFEEEGAKVIMARTLTEALLGVEDAGLSVAILDHGLGDDDSSKVCDGVK